MEFLFAIPVRDKTVFDSHIGITLNRSKARYMCVADDQGIPKTKSEKYYAAVTAAISNTDLADDDVVVFVHEDLNIVDMEYQEKLREVFTTRSDVGVVGIMGSRNLTEDTMEFGCGHYIQSDGQMVGSGKHTIVGSGPGFYDNVVVVDKSFFAVRASLIKRGIINFRNIPDDDFYSFDACVGCITAGYSVCVADILTYHKSSRWINDDGTVKTKYEQYVNLLKSEGITFPITKESLDTSSKTNVVEIEL